MHCTNVYTWYGYNENDELMYRNYTIKKNAYFYLFLCHRRYVGHMSAKHLTMNEGIHVFFIEQICQTKHLSIFVFKYSFIYIKYINIPAMFGLENLLDEKYNPASIERCLADICPTYVGYISFLGFHLCTLFLLIVVVVSNQCATNSILCKFFYSSLILISDELRVYIHIHKYKG